MKIIDIKILQGFGLWVTKHDDQLGKCFTLELTNVSLDTFMC